jgi:hypothetical protein
LEGNEWVGKGEKEESEIEEGIRSKFLLFLEKKYFVFVISWSWW